MHHISFSHWVLIVLLILFGFVLRLAPHAANVAPIAAIALFGSLYLPKRLALVLPLGVMLISDIFLGFYGWQIMASVYGSFLLVGIIGLWVRTHKTFTTVVLATVAGSCSFFFITNAAVWAFGTMYPHTISGLMQSYAMGLPFFRNTLLGDIVYVTFLIGGFEGVRYWIALHSFAIKKLAPRS